MFENILILALFLISLSIALALYRVIKGPSVPDRVMALDTIGIYLIAGVAILSVLLRTYVFFDIILELGILSFIGTIAFARYIERGYLIDRDHR